MYHFILLDIVYHNIMQLFVHIITQTTWNHSGGRLHPLFVTAAAFPVIYSNQKKINKNKNKNVFLQGKFQMLWYNFAIFAAGSELHPPGVYLYKTKKDYIYRIKVCSVQPCLLCIFIS